MATKNASKADKPLTEADILKMPEKDYMNEAQLAFFRDLLARMRDDILRKADETVEHMREVDNVSDPADRATVEEEHTLELRTRDRERKLLKKIEQAIDRIDAGEYGYCDETGEPIQRDATPADKFRSPYPNATAAAAGNGGAAPPDLSVMAKARHDGANYIYSLLSGYRAAPAGLTIRAGQHYNPYMAGDLTPFWTGDPHHVPEGGFIAMPPPLRNGQVTYDDGSPQTVDQYAKDVAAFIAWTSEPKMVERKQAGFGVILFLLIFAGVTYLSYRRVWKGVAH
ncbi:MAG: hypothetical protein A2352_10135 [Caulobacterales bacterium RIFOXYB1_FULL_67_16]|nr:MAG: hypothetical protein A2352_10135 [Caulobacterales bacterium RIFOXYB1_FULL_67_16]